MACPSLTGQDCGPFPMPQPASATEFAICLLFKDSAGYLDEWLRFHHLQGCRRFYLYDNESSDHFREVLAPWLEAGLVDLKTFPGRGIQALAYEDCLARARGQVRWLAFLDDDEFLHAPGRNSVLELLSDYEPYAGVAVCWVLFGSAGQERQTAAWVTERFTRSTGRPDAHVKCIVRPERIRSCVNIGHQFEPQEGFELVTEDARPIRSSFAEAPSASKLRINHYLIKSWEEWTQRRSRPQADTGVKTPLPESSWRGWDEDWSSSEDRALLAFQPAMKALRITPRFSLRRLWKSLLG